MKKIASISLIISGILMLCSGSTFAQEILTLEKALEIAYQQSPSIIQSKMSLEQSELALIQQKASLKSQFSLNLSPFQYTRSTSFDLITIHNGIPEIHEFRPWTSGSVNRSSGRTERLHLATRLTGKMTITNLSEPRVPLFQIILA